MLGYDPLVSHNPTFHVDMIFADTEVLEKHESKARTVAASVRLMYLGGKPGDILVIEFEQIVLFLNNQI